MIFFSHKYNTHLLMRRISQIADISNDKDYDDLDMKCINKLLDYSIDYNDLSLIKDTSEFWPTDISPNYMDILLNRTGQNNNNNTMMSNDDDESLYDNPNANEMRADIPLPKHECICHTQMSYILMRLLTNEHGSDWINNLLKVVFMR